MAKLPTKQDIQNRLRDEMAGIQQGRASLVPEGVKGESEVLPTIEELGLPTIIRRRLEGLILNHVELGKVERDAAKQRADLTQQIKALWAEHIGEETPKFYVGPNKVTRYTQNRESFGKDVARDTLLSLGVKPQVISAAWEAATTVKPVETLKVTPPGEA